MRKILFLILFLSVPSIYAQQPEKLNSSEIYKEIQKLNFLGSVLYVGAHPDDENTGLISFFSNNLHARTAYLSLTRGDGGQNLIGPELRELLGVIRTQELLAARGIDGGQQFFTRANDFGYSKNPKETFDIWNKKEILSDVVWVFRNFKPDVVVDRFSANSAGETHGHHTASAILSSEAFDLAGDNSAFPEQLDYVETWNPKRLFWNTSSWFYNNENEFEKAKQDFISFEIGVYYPLLGLSNPEIAALSRSNHKSQGFGSTGSRGSQKEYLKLISGKKISSENAIFEGINTSWSRLEAGKAIGDILNAVQKNYNFQDPSASIPELLKAYELIKNLKNEHWKKIKTEEIKEIIAACAGLYLEAVAAEPTATPGEEVLLNLEAINRSDQKMELLSVQITPIGSSISPEIPLENNSDWQQELKFIIPKNAEFSSPYWLKKEGSLGMYKVENQELIGKAESDDDFLVKFDLNINGTLIPFNREIVFKKNDPVKGEIYSNFEIVPKISVSLENNVVIFSDETAKIIPVKLTASTEKLQGKLILEHDNSWKVSPDFYDFQLPEKGEEKTFLFTVTPPAEQSEATLNPKVTINREIFSSQILKIDYEHIPSQTLILPAESKVVKLDIQKRGNLIGYIEGAGDVVPESLEQIGYKVVKISPEEISAENLKKFDAVVVGIRAYNIIDELKFRQNALFEYVKNGGNLIVQYNTNRGLKVEELAPFQLELSRDRVTDENAEIEILAENHPVLNFPNKISKADFEGWVQERGLYFPDKWGKEFIPILSMNDPGEAATKGSLLVAKYGDGYFVYTGLSFFREFPAGVPGAFRIFANMISLGK